MYLDLSLKLIFMSIYNFVVYFNCVEYMIVVTSGTTTIGRIFSAINNVGNRLHNRMRK
jgi:hypothetical protein